MRTSGFKGSMSSTTVTSSSSSTRGESVKGMNGRSKVSKTITVEDAMNEFHRLSSIVTRKVSLDPQKFSVPVTTAFEQRHITLILL
jgi:hypothetical protein